MFQIKKLAFILVLILITVTLLEVLLRFTGVFRVYSERIMGEFITDYNQNYESWYRTWGTDHDTLTLDHGEFRYFYQLNSLGLREREPDSTDTAALRIFVFGDSFTEGVGAAYDSAWPRRLEEFLLADGYDASLYNFGMSGNDPFYNHMLLVHKLLAFKPTHVLMSVNDSDFSDYTMRGGFERFAPDGTVRGKRAPWFHPAYQHSHFARWIVHLAGYDRMLVRRKHRKRMDREAYEKMLEALDSTRSVMERAGVKYLVVVQDTPYEACGERRKYRLDQFADNPRPFDAVIVGPEFREAVRERKCKGLNWPVDGHYNADGYELLARHVYAAIQRDYPGFFGR